MQVVRELTVHIYNLFINQLLFLYEATLYLSSSSVFQAENILKVELDMPNRTTRDYEGPLVTPQMQAALQEEEEITVDAS